MPSSELKQLKKRLLAEGFEIYRSAEASLRLADRVRENLIMDGQVSAEVDPLAVVFVTRAQRSECGGLGEASLFESARQLGHPGLARGYSEESARTLEIPDPGDRSRVLDTWYEVSFRKLVAGTEELAEELRFALRLEKTVRPLRAQ